MQNKRELQQHLEEQFQLEFGRLNPEQKEAVDAIEGPVLVLAGPGTGKTQVLALRVANILRQTDVGPRGILAMTFTEAGAENMRERLLRIVGPDAYEITIVTFHAFCGEVIRENAESFPEFGLAVPLSELDRYQIMQDILEHNRFERLRPVNQPLRNIDRILTAIGELKRENVDRHAYLQLVLRERELFEMEKSSLKKTALADRIKHLEKQEELAELYALYEQELRARKFYDFDDMLIAVGNAFLRDDVLLQRYQERYAYFLTDEYQDTNGAQNAILDRLASFWGEEANLFAVGDVHQSIFRFQGASLENTLSFLERYPRAKVITLKQNYRSGQTILNAAAEVIAFAELGAETGSEFAKMFRVTEPLLSASGKSDLPVRVATFPTEFAERVFVAEDIRKKLDNGHNPKEIAVLVKTNQEAMEIARVFGKMNVPAQLFSGDGVLAEPVVQQTITLLRAVHDLRTGDDTSLFTYLSYPWVGVDHRDLLAVSRAAGSFQTQTNLGQMILDGETALPSEVVLQHPQQFWRAAELLRQWSQSEALVTFPEWMERVLQESGLLDAVWSGKSAVSDLSIAFDNVSIADQVTAIQSFFELVKQWAQAYALPNRLRLDDCLRRLSVMEENGLDIPRAPLEVELPAVSILTVFKAKGLEWDHVYVLGCANEHWGNSRLRERLELPAGLLRHAAFDATQRKQQENEDARRLFYVAMTRARESLFLSYGTKRLKSGQVQSRLQCVFLGELSEQFVARVDVQSFLAESAEEFKKLLLAPAQHVFGPSMRAWLSDCVDKLVLSPTGLNTYLECPRKFLFSSVARVPRAKSSVFAYGTAIHAALELYFNEWVQKEVPPPLDRVLRHFEQALRKESLTEQEFLLRLGQGERDLTAYFAHYENQFRRPVVTEKRIPSSRILEVEGVKIGGKVDKVEWVNQAKGEVCIIDYKTGQPRSRNEIEGATKGSDGRYKRQLVFYRLLAELDGAFPGKVVEAGLDFVQPERDTHAFKKEIFKITDEEVAELKHTIKEVGTQLKNLEFPKTREYSVCETCEFRSICWPDGSFPVRDSESEATVALSPERK